MFKSNNFKYLALTFTDGDGSVSFEEFTHYLGAVSLLERQQQEQQALVEAGVVEN